MVGEFGVFQAVGVLNHRGVGGEGLSHLGGAGDFRRSGRRGIFLLCRFIFLYALLLSVWVWVV